MHVIQKIEKDLVMSLHKFGKIHPKNEIIFDSCMDMHFSSSK